MPFRFFWILIQRRLYINHTIKYDLSGVRVFPGSGFLYRTLYSDGDTDRLLQADTNEKADRISDSGLLYILCISIFYIFRISRIFESFYEEEMDPAFHVRKNRIFYYHPKQDFLFLTVCGQLPQDSDS